MDGWPAFRIATLEDLPALHRLIERAYRGDTSRRGWSSEADLLDGQRTDQQELAEILADERRSFLIAEEPSGVVGCVLIADKGDGLAYLGMLSVEPDLQAAGLGRRLMAAAEEEAVRRFTARRMEMRVIKDHRPELIAWYERRGYRLNGREEPFPMHDPRAGIPKKPDLAFVVLEKVLA